MTREDGLLERRCGRCHWSGPGSAGQPCPSCEADPEDYGPIYLGRVEVVTLDCRGDALRWYTSREWIPQHQAEELVREGFGRWIPGERRVFVELGRPTFGLE